VVEVLANAEVGETTGVSKPLAEDTSPGVGVEGAVSLACMELEGVEKVCDSDGELAVGDNEPPLLLVILRKALLIRFTIVTAEMAAYGKKVQTLDGRLTYQGERTKSLYGALSRTINNETFPKQEKSHKDHLVPSE
jgi:hypothetical protein